MASFPRALSHEWPCADNLSIGQGAEESVLELNGVDDEAIGTFTFSFKGRQPFRVANHLHLALFDGVASIEEALEAKTRPGIGSIHQGTGLLGVLLGVVFDHLVVAVSRSFICPAHPKELPTVRVIDADDRLVRDPIRAEDGLVGPEEAVATLHNKFGVERDVVLFAGSRSRKLFVPDSPGVPSNEMIVGSSCLHGPSSWDEAMFKDFLKHEEVA